MNTFQASAYLELLAEMGIKCGLEHTLALSRLLDSPEGSFPSVLVAGTNGKGSTCAFLAAILYEAGCRPGLYTSPHLVDVRERIRVGGACIPEEDFARGLSQVRRAAEEAVERGLAEGLPTYFEALTLLAFLHFRSERVSLAVLEVGLGGKWDCTNIAEPCLSVVTTIGLDHEEWLGPGVRYIAREKAGVFRPFTPALTAVGAGGALEVLEKEASRAGARLKPLSECVVERRDNSWRLACPEGELELPPPSLPGEHQYTNAALACRAALCLRQQGWRIPDEAIAKGVSAAMWPARLQRFPGNPEVYLDGAHNPDGCRALAGFVEGLPCPRTLVFAVMRDKPAGEMLSILAPAFDLVIATELPMERCALATQLREFLPPDRFLIVPDPVSALEEAKRLAGPAGIVAVAGSLYLAGALLPHLQGGRNAGTGTREGKPVP